MNQKYDLEERTLEFAKKVLDLVSQLPRTIVNREHISQITRSSGSVGANYREANEALGKKDFFLRIRICRKEAKETRFWLELLLHSNSEFEKAIKPLVDESTELIKIFSAIASKASS